MQLARLTSTSLTALDDRTIEDLTWLIRQAAVTFASPDDRD